MVDIRTVNGVDVYTLNGKPHRANGPAFDGPFGLAPWYLFGKTHRYYGAAGSNLKTYTTWFIHGREIKC